MSSYYNNNQNNQNNNKNSDWLSWTVIAVMFFGGAWFIAIPLLLYKLFGPDQPKSQRQSAPSLYQTQQTAQNRYASGTASSSAAAEKVKDTFHSMMKTPAVSGAGALALALAGAFVALVGLAILTDAAGTFELLFGTGWILGGAAMIFSGVSTRKAIKRYPRYMAVIGSNQAVHIKTLAKKIGVSDKTARRDLQKMVDKGFFGNAAYINDELGYLFVTSKADEELQAARKAAQAKAKEARAEKAKQAEAAEVDTYESLVLQIRDVNDRIAHVEMSRKIDKLESITREIFRTVREDPSKRRKIDKFMTYYLPTTLKLLESYARLEKTGQNSDNISQSRATIEDAMDNIVTGFENQLDELYKSDAMDIETDIDVMTRMMSREAPASDFEVPAAEPEDTRTQFEKDFGATVGENGTITYGGSAAQTQQEKH